MSQQDVEIIAYQVCGCGLKNTLEHFNRMDYNDCPASNKFSALNSKITAISVAKASQSLELLTGLQPADWFWDSTKIVTQSWFLMVYKTLQTVNTYIEGS